ncbi:hypothetical protein QFZ96_001823 [Paraburkholderia youngii]
MENDALWFECDNCGTRFSAMLFEIARQLERVEFLSTMTSICIRDCDTLSGFCSIECRDSSRRAVMEREDVPIRRVDSFGPIAPCAKCGGPVDMTEFHVTYVENDLEIINPNMMQPTSVECLAVLCSNCWQNKTTSSEAACAEDGSAKSVSESLDVDNMSTLDFAEGHKSVMFTARRYRRWNRRPSHTSANFRLEVEYRG